MRSRAVLAGALLAGAVFTAAPAQATCLDVWDDVTPWCSPCDPISSAYNTVTREFAPELGTMSCAA